MAGSKDSERNRFMNNPQDDERGAIVGALARAAGAWRDAGRELKANETPVAKGGTVIKPKAEGRPIPRREINKGLVLMYGAALGLKYHLFDAFLGNKSAEAYSPNPESNKEMGPVQAGAIFVLSDKLGAMQPVPVESDQVRVFGKLPAEMSAKPERGGNQVEVVTLFSDLAAVDNFLLNTVYPQFSLMPGFAEMRRADNFEVTTNELAGVQDINANYEWQHLPGLKYISFDVTLTDGIVLHYCMPMELPALNGQAPEVDGAFARYDVVIETPDPNDISKTRREVIDGAIAVPLVIPKLTDTISWQILDKKPNRPGGDSVAVGIGFSTEIVTNPETQQKQADGSIIVSADVDYLRSQAAAEGVGPDGEKLTPTQIESLRLYVFYAPTGSMTTTLALPEQIDSLNGLILTNNVLERTNNEGVEGEPSGVDWLDPSVDLASLRLNPELLAALERQNAPEWPSFRIGNLPVVVDPGDASVADKLKAFNETGAPGMPLTKIEVTPTAQNLRFVTETLPQLLRENMPKGNIAVVDSEGGLTHLDTNQVSPQVIISLQDEDDYEAVLSQYGLSKQEATGIASQTIDFDVRLLRMYDKITNTETIYAFVPGELGFSTDSSSIIVLKAMVFAFSDIVNSADQFRNNHPVSLPNGSQGHTDLIITDLETNYARDKNISLE